MGQFKTNKTLNLSANQPVYLCVCGVYSNRMKRENKFVEYREHGRKADRINLVFKASPREYAFVCTYTNELYVMYIILCMPCMKANMEMHFTLYIT